MDSNNIQIDGFGISLINSNGNPYNSSLGSAGCSGTVIYNSMYITLANFTHKYGESASVWIEPSDRNTSSGLSSNILIQNCFLRTNSYGIWITGGSNITITNCDISNSAFNQTSGEPLLLPSGELAAANSDCVKLR
jgi:hypothetical protein